LPHVIVKLAPGRTEEQKTRLTEAILKDVMSLLSVSEEAVSVGIEEVNSGEWTEKVYKPDIQNKWQTLYKKPGYDPL
jgi:4-oxalocrotonate tautomerase